MVNIPEVGAPAPEGGLLDLRDVDFADLLAGEASPQLNACTARAIANLNDPDGVISAFQSFTS